MIFNDDTKTKLMVRMSVSVNPTGKPIRLKIGSVWYPMAWVGQPEAVARGRWSQMAVTEDVFSGPAVLDPEDSVVLARGVHYTETDFDGVVNESTPIEVV